jgi:hypothetical protein
MAAALFWLIDAVDAQPVAIRMTFDGVANHTGGAILALGPLGTGQPRLDELASHNPVFADRKAIGCLWVIRRSRIG